MNNLYLYLNIAAVSLPLLLSFDRKVAFYKKWKSLSISIFLMSIIFIGWDIIFNLYGIWGFNDVFLTGYRLAGLPLEEWLFFFTVPYSSVFIYECVKTYLKKDIRKKIHYPILFVLSITLLVTAILNFRNIYTFSTFSVTSVVLGYLLLKRPFWLSKFFLSYLILLIPFLLMNSILTGRFTEEPVVWYNSAHILNIRILTIPIEDFIYSLLMQIITIWLFEKLKNRIVIKPTAN